MRRVGVTSLTFALLLAGCGATESPDAVQGDEAPAVEAPGEGAVEAPGEGSAETPTAERLPPHERDDLVALFDPVVRPLGYQVTRAALITRSTYAVDPAGDHLAIYVAPVTDISFDRFAADLAPLASAFLPLVFERWPDLVSFDICQEPFESAEQTPPSLTIVDLDRNAASQAEWDALDLPTLIRYGSEIDGFTVWARGGVRNSVTWSAAATG